MVGFFAAIVLTAIGIYLDHRGWQPKPQPIVFSHQVHVGERQIDCAFCHTGARTGDIAGVPSVAECASCHNVIQKYQGDQKERTDEFNAELAKLQQHIKDKTPISWSKVYDLPEHVKFSHQAHITAGIDCARCHGDVAKMNVVSLENIPNMGWCISCHKENDAPINCSDCHF